MNRRLAGQAALAMLATMLMGAVAAAHAKDCAGATPLPANVTITPPAADVSPDLARFSGAWGGAWETFSFNVHDRWTVLRWTRTPGRAAGF